MAQLWDFSGGIHPAEHKQRSTAHAIRAAGIPGLLVLPLQQHIGEPAEPVVAVGDRVLKGQTIADASRGMGVPVHAPTSGTIESIAGYPVPHPSGMTDTCIVLKPDGKDEWCERYPISDYRTLDRNQVLDIIRAAGISGMGGSGFPTDIKLNPTPDCKIHTLVLNGAECEPYITADDMTMRERANEVIAGLTVMAWILDPERCVIGIEDNKPEAAAALRVAIQGAQDTQAAKATKIEIAVIPTKYPSGGEKQLIQVLTGMEVPSGGIPADIGIVSQNIGTAAAVARAVFDGTPLIGRIVTVTGEALEKPGNFDVLLGTPVDYLLEQAGLQPDLVSRLVLGGPMMGYTLTTTAVPVIKTSNCIIAATAHELPASPPEQACIRCGQCAEVCPMELLPQQLFWHAKADEFEKAEHLNLFDCIECGACSYVCPSSIPLVQYYRYAKGEVRGQRAEQFKADRARERFEARQQRLEREQHERELRRKERAKAASDAQATKNAAAEKAAVGGEVIDKRASRSALVEQALARKKASTKKASATQTKTPPTE